MRFAYSFVWRTSLGVGEGRKMAARNVRIWVFGSMGFAMALAVGCAAQEGPDSGGGEGAGAGKANAGTGGIKIGNGGSSGGSLGKGGSGGGGAGSETCGNGLDDDQNGSVDDKCSCSM